MVHDSLLKKSFPGEKRVIITSDDFGISPHVNKAVIRSHLDGCLSSTSIVPVADESSYNEAVDILKDHNSLDFGIHITLCSDKEIRFKPLTGCTNLEASFLYSGPC